jgi:hypothetical protein
LSTDPPTHPPWGTGVTDFFLRPLAPWPWQHLLLAPVRSAQYPWFLVLGLGLRGANGLGIASCSPHSTAVQSAKHNFAVHPFGHPDETCTK